MQTRTHAHTHTHKRIITRTHTPVTTNPKLIECVINVARLVPSGAAGYKTDTFWLAIYMYISIWFMYTCINTYLNPRCKTFPQRGYWLQTRHLLTRCIYVYICIDLCLDVQMYIIFYFSFFPPCWATGYKPNALWFGVYIYIYVYIYIHIIYIYTYIDLRMHVSVYIVINVARLVLSRDSECPLLRHIYIYTHQTLSLQKWWSYNLLSRAGERHSLLHDSNQHDNTL